jgi:hypothetical protein
MSIFCNDKDFASVLPQEKAGLEQSLKIVICGNPEVILRLKETDL